MKKILLSSVAFLGLSAGAFAADLPSRRAPAPAFAAVPVFTWTGFYVGVNLGYGWGNNDDSNVVTVPAGTFGPASTIVTFHDNNENNGVIGGAQIGYNFQTGNFVFGVEADIQAADLNDDGSVRTATAVGSLPPAGFVFARRSNGIDWFGTVRARAGVAFDRTLVYATGGFAFGGGDNDNCGGIFAGGVVGCGGNDDTRSGWTVGGGVEYAFTNNLTLGVEGLYVSLDNDNNRTTFVGRTAGGVAVVAPSTFSTGNDDLDFTIVRAKLNWKF
ncbi:MAG TPA: outer membrane beta-barrel protein [Beijerinckiaceae bacterium]|nr:outer membrane beta-barrel protein [Beijerinckiaceae bacterium]